MTARRRLAATLLACAACVPGAVAHAAGPPLPSADSGRAGAVAPGGSERLVALPAGADTLLTAFARDGARALRSRQIAGRWSVAAAALDGATTGLSADGGTLVLVRPTRSFPPAETRLAVVDVRTLRLRREIALRGFFTVDAVAPDGARVYLVQYPRPDDFLDYRVRALDTRTGRLAARDVVDPRSPGEQMGGLPMTRTTSADGRWFYTLYGGGDETFIHALDTVGATAACIDLDMIPPDGDLAGLQLQLGADGGKLAVRDGTTLLATVDARTFAVREAATAPAPATGVADSPAPGAEDGGFPWTMLPVAVAALAALAVLARRRGRPLLPTRAK